MSRSHYTLLAVGLALAGLTLATAAGKTPTKHPAASDQQLIDSALRAAPRAVAAHAAVSALNPDGSMRSLRKGSNGFTCIPDEPTTPGPDPMCMDQAALEWAGALMGHKTPTSGKVGLMYMLAGGTDASNTDPYAKTAAGNHWIKTGPHVMVVGADAGFYAMYPKQADPDTGVPYVMWAGTPYQHLMVPVK